jgi:magnesium-transporting ATPase (P-type)
LDLHRLLYNEAILTGEAFSVYKDAEQENADTGNSNRQSQAKKIGLCGQAPSDFPEFSNFLLGQLTVYHLTLML